MRGWIELASYLVVNNMTMPVFFLVVDVTSNSKLFYSARPRQFLYGKNSQIPVEHADDTYTHTKKKKKKKASPTRPSQQHCVWSLFTSRFCRFFGHFSVVAPSIIIRLHGLPTFNLSALVAFLSESQLIELFRPIGFFIL